MFPSASSTSRVFDAFSHSGCGVEVLNKALLMVLVPPRANAPLTRACATACQCSPHSRLQDDVQSYDDGKPVRPVTQCCSLNLSCGAWISARVRVFSAPLRFCTFSPARGFPAAAPPRAAAFAPTAWWLKTRQHSTPLIRCGSTPRYSLPVFHSGDVRLDCRSLIRLLSRTLAAGLRQLEQQQLRSHSPRRRDI
jgi:hypothetical protein